MADQTSTELATWIEYERLDAERQVNMVRNAIVLAFQKPATTSTIVDDDDDEIIDTTASDFSEKFTFVNA